MNERDLMIVKHIPFVHFLAKKYRSSTVAWNNGGKGSGLAYEDIVNEGICGLIRAVDRYDPSYEVKPYTYFGYHIREAMDAYVKTYGVIVLPTYIARRQQKLYKAMNAYLLKHGVEATDEELSKLTGFTQTKIVELKQLRETKKNATDEDEFYGLSAEIQEEPVAITADLFEGLAERDITVLKMRNGYVEGKLFTLNEISERLGLSKERVRQIESRALDKLRDKKLRRLENIGG